MIGSWIAYTVLVSALAAAAAAAIEPTARAARLPTRYLWAGAMIVSVALAAYAPVRNTALGLDPRSNGTEAVQATASSTAETASPTPADPLAAFSALPDILGDALGNIPEPGPRATAAIGLAWLGFSLLLLIYAISTVRRYRARMAAWPVHSVDGTRVRVSPAAGPFVLGLPRPEIVVPAWLLGAPVETRRAVLLHEGEHLRARDPHLLEIGALLAILVPWLIPLWWMFRRLRLAVEVDCDARVLRRGLSRGVYGSALLDVAARRPTLDLGLPALAGSISSLERRLHAMNRELTRGGAVRIAMLAPLGLTALLVACETEMPTAAEIEAMDVASLEYRTVRFGSFDADSARYFLDGEPITAEEAHEIPADRIAEIAVRGGVTGSRVAEVRISTRRQISGTVQSDAVVLDSLVQGPQIRGANVLSTAPSRQVGASPIPPDVLFIVDGEVVEASDFTHLDPEAIATISVLKGDAVGPYASDPRAAAGVIVITTKAATP